MVNGYSIVTYQRPLKASDELDQQIYTNGSQAIIWGVGPLNDKGEVSFHSHYLKGDRFIEFSRPPAWNCPISELQDQPQQHQPQQSQQLNVDRAQNYQDNNAQVNDAFSKFNYRYDTFIELIIYAISCQTWSFLFFNLSIASFPVIGNIYDLQYRIVSFHRFRERII